MHTATTVTINRLTDPAELYHRYPREFAPQPVAICLDLETGRLYASWRAGNGWSEAEWHGRTLAWSIPPLTADAANGLLEEIAPLAQRIIDGASIDWDGHNHVGVLGDDAQAARDEIERLTDIDEHDMPTVGCEEAEEWCRACDEDPTDDHGLTADTPDDQLDDIAERLEEEIRQQSDGVVVVYGAREYVESRRAELRQAVRDELVEIAEQLKELREQRDELIRRIHQWRVDSIRDIGDLAGVSHTQVRRIVRAKASD